MKFLETVAAIAIGSVIGQLFIQLVRVSWK